MAFIKPCERADDHETHTVGEVYVPKFEGDFRCGGQICPGIGDEGMQWWHNDYKRKVGND